MQSSTTSSEITQAFYLLDQGNLIQAKKLFEALAKEGEEQAHSGLQKTYNELTRKYWRQGKIAEMQKIAPENAQIALARIQGKNALHEVASSNPEKFFAVLSLKNSPKEALFSLQEIPGYKEIAQGWLFLLNQDFVQAEQSFQNALASQPKRAKIGLALLDVINSRFEEGQSKVHKFLKVALHRFPLFAEAMGKKNQGSETEVSCHLINQAFYQGKADFLEKLLSELHPLQKKEKGWILARLGDLEYSKESGANYDKAAQYWNKAAHVFPGLKLDIAKKKLLTTKNSEEKRHLFLEYFQGLYNQNKNEASSFLQNFLPFQSPTFFEKLPIPFFSNAQKKWTLSNPPIELSLLALRVIARQYHSFISANPPLLFLSRQNLVPSLLVEALHDLDSIFLNEEFYLRLKLDIYSLTGQISEKRKALAKLLELNIDKAETLLPKYVQCALFTQKDPLLGEEVENLCSLYSNSFDLARLLYLCHKEESAERYAATFPTCLQNVLLLQVRVDCKVTEKTEELFEKALITISDNDESTWRFWHAVATSQDIEFKKIENAFDALLSTPEKRNSVFSKISSYQETQFNEQFIEYWIESTEDWTPHMFNFLQALEDQNEDSFPTPPYGIRPDASSLNRISALLPILNDLSKDL